MESDYIIFVEGDCRAHSSKEFISHKELEDNKYEELETMYYSAGEGEEDHRKKMDLIDFKSTPRLGIFEKNKYFDNIFPSLKIQKPGYDLYASTTFFLAFTLIYVFAFYNSMSVDKADYITNK